ncbi:MAG: sensor histidine kinase KdpD, partial [Polyangiaceae bacterium]|nr:sensor histidine kinase KdpD [Polyangiaceae bacterium]
MSTSEPEDRPDPDALLRKVQAEEARGERAKLHIFFGFAPGVGKTFRMLQVARDMLDQKIDVVVGLVETHKRADTETALLGLPSIPRRSVEYRGHTLEEFDLEAALQRKPRVLVLDELAHTNAPGARHAKRYQDVLELLEAGIDVLTTVNVQHVESLNDVVAQITHVQVRETVPDSVFERADEVVLVDVSPEELLARLRDGKIYLGPQAERAASHFFRRGNLLALRELALRRTAERVDADVQQYREEHGVAAIWPTGERILVCVGASPSSSKLVRSACNIASGLRGQWVAAYVETLHSAGLSAENQKRLEAHLQLAESLGGKVARLSGRTVSEAILAYARKENITRIVVGKPTHSRLRDRLRGSLLDDIVRGSGDMDVLVIRGDDTEAPQVVASAEAPLALVKYANAALLVCVTTALAAAIRAVYPVPDLEVLYLLAVMIAGVFFGRGPSLLAALLGVAAYDFFFVPPFYTFAVTDAKYVLTFAMMFGVGVLVSELTARIRTQEKSAIDREKRTAMLYAFSRDLGGVVDLQKSADIVAEHAARAFDCTAWVLSHNLVKGSPDRVSSSDPARVLDEKERGVAKWVFEHNRRAGNGTDTLPGSSTMCVPLAQGDEVLAVLSLLPHRTGVAPLAHRDFLEAFSVQATFALERARLAEQAATGLLRAKSEEMRSALLSAVSHDLRTPLAAITGSATSLRDDPNLPAEVRADLLQAICEEAERLERLVSNLLDMTRLSSGTITLKPEWIPLEEMVGSALNRLEVKLGGRPISVHIPTDFPLLSVDPVLFEQIFVNLLENAAKYTPPLSPIDISASQGEGILEVHVLDRGPGLTGGTEGKLFERFYRGSHTGISGAGLGLSICR